MRWTAIKCGAVCGVCSSIRNGRRLPLIGATSADLSDHHLRAHSPFACPGLTVPLYWTHNRQLTAVKVSCYLANIIRRDSRTREKSQDREISENNVSRMQWARNPKENPLKSSTVFCRRITVVGEILQYFHEFSISDCGRRFWIASSHEMTCEGDFCQCKSRLFVTSHINTKVSRFNRRALSERGLTSIHIPSSTEVSYEFCFSGCKSLASVVFDADSRISRFNRSAFLRLFAVDSHPFIDWRTIQAKSILHW
jgi:hypothetical protein